VFSRTFGEGQARTSSETKSSAAALAASGRSAARIQSNPRFAPRSVSLPRMIGPPGGGRPASGRPSCADPGTETTGSWHCSKAVSTAAATTQAAGTRRPTASGCGSCARTSFRLRPDWPAYESGRGGFAGSRPVRSSRRAHRASVESKSMELSTVVFNRGAAARGGASGASRVDACRRGLLAISRH
jgi:hypothetical protein